MAGFSSDPLLAFCVFFFSVILVYECRVLNGYASTVYSTKWCPQDKIEIKERSSALNCSTRDSYMCIPDETLTHLFEFCYVDRAIQVPKGVFLIVSKRFPRLGAYICSNLKAGCPADTYYSNRIYEHPCCFSVEKGCFLADRFCMGFHFNAPSINDVTSSLDYGTVDAINIWKITTQNSFVPKKVANTSVIFYITLWCGIILILGCIINSFNGDKDNPRIGFVKSRRMKSVEHIQQTKKTLHKSHREEISFTRRSYFSPPNTDNPRIGIVNSQRMKSVEVIQQKKKKLHINLLEEIGLLQKAIMPPKKRARRDDVATGGVPPPTPPTEVLCWKKGPKRTQKQLDYNDNHNYNFDYGPLVNDIVYQQKAASEKQNISESVGQPPMVNSVEDTAPVVGEAIPAAATIPAFATAKILGTLLINVFTGSLQLIYMLICIKEIFFLAFCLQIIVSTQKKNLDDDERRLAETVKDAVDLLPHILRKIYTGARNVKSNYQENDCGRCLTQAFLKRFPGVKVLISKYQEPYTLVCQSEDFYIPENFNERISDSFSMEITSRYRTIVVANRMDPIHKIRWCRTRLEMKPRINIAINHITIHDTWRCVLQRRNNALGLLIEKENTYLDSKRVADIPICFNAFRNTWCCLLPKQGDTVIFSFGTENEYLDSRQMFVANVIYIALKGNWLYILLKNSNAGQSTCTSETKDTSKKKKEYSIVKLKVDKGATLSLPIITNNVESEACQWMCTAQTSISDIQISSDAWTFLSDIRKECFTMKSSYEDMSDTSMSTVSALRKDDTKRGRSQQK